MRQECRQQSECEVSHFISKQWEKSAFCSLRLHIHIEHVRATVYNSFTTVINIILSHRSVSTISLPLYWKLLFLVSFFKQLLLKNCAVNFDAICKVCTRKAIIKAAKMIFNSDKICRSYIVISILASLIWNTMYSRYIVQIDDRQTETDRSLRTMSHSHEIATSCLIMYPDVSDSCRDGVT